MQRQGVGLGKIFVSGVHHLDPLLFEVLGFGLDALHSLGEPASQCRERGVFVLVISELDSFIQEGHVGKAQSVVRCFGNLYPVSP